MTAEIEARRSISGLRPECLTFPEIIAQSIANIAPTVTPALGASLVFANAGNGTWLAFVIATIGLTFVGLNINQFARRSASPGSLYAYIAKGLGPTAGVLTGWALVLAYTVTAMAVVCGFANFANVLLGLFHIHLSDIALFAVCAAIAWYLSYKDIRLSTSLMLALEGVSVSLIAILGLIVWVKHGFTVDVTQLSLKGASPASIELGLVLAVFSFVGFESATALGDEAKKPLQFIPRAVIVSTVISGLFFIVLSYIEILGFEGYKTPFDKADAPLNTLADLAGVGFFGVLISIGATISFFACTVACINAGARVFFSMARHGIFHSAVGQAHGSNETPHVAVTMSALIAFLFPASISMFGVKVLDAYGYFGTVATYGFLFAYILVSIAAPIYLYRQRELHPVDVLVSVIAVLFMLIPIVGSVYPVPPFPSNVFPYLFLMLMAVGGGWFLMLRLHSPEVIEEMERDIEDNHTRFSDMRKI
jgi:amino acid transporter